MKHLFYTWKLGCLLLLILAGCSSKKSVSSYHSFESECLGVELDGSETLRAWGRGKNRTLNTHCRLTGFTKRLKFLRYKNIFKCRQQ